jgi:hypothetical protein
MHNANPNLIVKANTMEERINRNPKSPLEEILEYHDLTGLGSGKLFESDALQPPSSLSWSTPRPTSSLMDDSVDFDFHHSCITSALFCASILAILYLSRLFALAQLVDRECIASNGGEVR